MASVIAQTRTDWECLVVDDSGDDRPLALPDDPRVHLLRHETPRGPAAARNTGISSAAGSVVTFLDDDDRYVPERLELAARGLVDPAVAVAICWATWFDPRPPGANPSAPGANPSAPGANPSDRGSPAGAGSPTAARRRPLVPAGAPGRRLDGDVWHQVLDATTPHLGATAVRRSQLEPFDERYRAVEDVEWWLRTARRSRVATVGQVGCELRRHPGERANGTDVAGRLIAGRQLLDDHAEYFRLHPRAEAFRLARMGVLAAGSCRRAEARRLLIASLRRRPSALAARQLVRTLW